MFRQGLLAMCVAALLPTSLAVASQPESARGTNPLAAVDVAMASGGVVKGQVVQPDGQPAGEVPVTVISGSQPVTSTQTDLQGKFTVSGLRGGAYGLMVGQDGPVRAIRLWAPGTAPPSAQQTVLLSTESPLVRGQTTHTSRVYRWFSENPLLGYGLITAAIALPVVLINEDDDAS